MESEFDVWCNEAGGVEVKIGFCLDALSQTQCEVKLHRKFIAYWEGEICLHCNNFLRVKTNAYFHYIRALLSRDKRNSVCLGAVGHVYDTAVYMEIGILIKEVQAYRGGYEMSTFVVYAVTFMHFKFVSEKTLVT